MGAKGVKEMRGRQRMLVGLGIRGCLLTLSRQSRETESNFSVAGCEACRMRE